MEEVTIRCECHTPDHTIFFDYDEQQGELYMTVHLTTHRNFFQRLWYGIKYAFGYQSRFGAWDEVVIKWEDCPKIKALLDKRETHPSRFVLETLERMDQKTKE